MLKVCNLCNTLSRKDAQSICGHEACPHKEEVKQVFIVLTEQDLIDSPELAAQGYKVGDHLFADNAGNTAILTPPEPHLPPGGIVPAAHEGIAHAANEPAQGDPGDEQPAESKSFIGKLADFITGK